MSADVSIRSEDVILDKQLEAYLKTVPRQADEAMCLSLKEFGGALDPVKVSRQTMKLVDGYRRVHWCRELGLPFPEIKLIDCVDDFEAMRFMKLWQYLRRCGNITEQTLGLADALKGYVAEEVAKGMSPRPARGKATARVAEEAGVTKRTVQRAEKMAKYLESVEPGIRRRIKAGEIKAGVAPIKQLAEFTHDDQREIVRQLDAGEFKSLAGAINGEKPDGTPEEEEPDTELPTEPASVASVAAHELSEAMELLGKFNKRIRELDEHSNNAARFHACRSLIRNLQIQLEEWEKDLKRDVAAA